MAKKGTDTSKQVAETTEKVDKKSEKKQDKKADKKVEKKVEDKVEKKVEKKAGKKAEKAEKAEKVEEVQSVEDKKAAKKEAPKKAAKTAVKGKAPKKAAQKGGDVEVEEKKTRYFRCVYRSTDGSVVRAGRYCGRKPKQAASKALTAIIKSTDGEVNQPVKFLITECTRGSKKKSYSYSGEQKKIDPVTVEIKREDGKINKIVYKKSNVISKISLEECVDLRNANLDDDQDGGVVLKKAAKKEKVVEKKTEKKGKEEEAPKKETKSKPVASKGSSKPAPKGKKSSK
jgi:hypothetical protein